MRSTALKWAAAAHGAISGPVLSILIFHRVLDKPDALLPGEVDAARFDALMGLVARSFRVVTVGQALARLQAGQLLPRTLAITFDDGYADNAEIALPVLQRHGLSASFFIATGFLDGGRMFNDTIIESVRRSVRDTLDLHDFGLGRLPLATPQQRRSAIDAVIPKIKYMPLQAREGALQQLARACGDPALPETLMMRSVQVQNLHRAGMEIGGHTVNHPILAQTPDAEARREIEQGRDVLSALIDAPVNVFAYPNGRPHEDYDARHVDMVREIGFRGAVSTARGVATPGADRCQLPRFAPWDRSVTKWSLRLLMNLRETSFARVGTTQSATDFGLTP